MPFDVVGAMDRAASWQLIEAEVRAAFGLPPAQVGATCRQCMAGEGHLDVACVNDPAYQEPPRADVLDQIDRAVDGLCPCGAEPATGSAYCSDDCRPTHRGPDTDAIRDGGPHAARWRPDLVDVFDDSDLELVRAQRGRVFSRRHLTRRWYRYRHSDGWFFRLDDGNRFVGVEVAAEVASDDDGALAVWGRLERELTDRRRLDPDPAPRPANAWSDVLTRMGEALDREVLGREGEWAVLAGQPDPRAAGTVFWTPDVVYAAAPTMAELAAGVDLTPYVPRGPIWRGRSLAGQLSAGDRITVHWSNAGADRAEVTELVVSEVAPDGTVTTEPVDRDGTVDRFHEVGRRIVAAGAGAIAGYQMLPAAAQQAVQAAAQAESDRVALRAVCTDEAMYERALAVARESGMSTRQMLEAVARGRYTQRGWENR